ncbi:hypothetical protein MF672_001420 [Actinomadura sp. ATCC 31491]|uniref:Uncharacterized protein n=1 Tax=Actinomadura luzonensis TaxID=2805427 RepID=A0ABT0FJG4_9ACTN|nr:hypothetical protein [Actinomadura luzonensis]MCK2212464.1 hypothetical protein [Actinomadura luzonensis]
MPTLLAELLDPHKRSDHLYGVADVEEPWHLYEIDLAAGDWAGAADNGVALQWRADTHLLKYELWDGPPPPLTTWDATWSGSVRMGCGRVSALSGHGGGVFSGAEFDLGRREAVWQVRVHRKSLGHEEFTAELVGCTVFKIQFWAAPPGR